MHPGPQQLQRRWEAFDFVKSNGALVTHDNLAEFAALSHGGFARDPRELLALAQWSDHVSGFRVSCEPFS